MGSKKFGRKLRRLRKAANLTQEQLAEKVDVSSFQLISQWERGLKRPGRKRVIQLIEIFADQFSNPEEARRWALQAEHEPTLKELQRIFQDYVSPPAQPLFEKPRQHPPLPDTYTHRQAIEQNIHDFLVPAGPQKTLVLSGPGGVGKSTLAAWATEELGSQFPDGILWLDYPAEHGVFEVQERIARSFKVVLSRTSLAERAGEVRSILRQKQCLLVLDDVWGNSDLVYLKVHNDQCPMLITTRDKGIAHLFESLPPIEVGGLTPLEGRDMLKQYAGFKISTAQLDELVNKFEGFPLALSLMGALLQTGFTLSDLLAEFGGEQLDLSILDLGDPQNRFTSLNRCFDLSYERLPSNQMRQYFAQLSCLAGTFSPEAAAKLWGTKPSEARRVLHQFVRFNLVTRQAQGYRLHSLLKDYARQRLSSDWADLEQTTRRRHAAYHILHRLDHPQILDGVTDEAPDLDQSWADIIAGVKWATAADPELAAIATVLAHTERQALWEAVEPPLIEVVEKYLAQVANQGAQAILHELLGDMYLWQENNDAALAHFEQASTLWLAEENVLAGSRAKLRIAGIYLLQEEPERAALITRQVQAMLGQTLPLAGTDLAAAHRLFYWFNVIYSVLVKWDELPENDVAALADSARQTGQPLLEARGLHIYRLWCTAGDRLQNASIRRKARQLAARAARLWCRHGEKDKAQAEVMWTQEYTRGRRSRWLEEAFARRRSQMTPELSQEQIELIKHERLRQWLVSTEHERINWLVKNLPPPGSDEWHTLDDILNIGIRGKQVRQLAQGIPRPENHSLTEPMWLVFSGQKTLPLTEETAREMVKRYRTTLQETLR